MMVQRHQMVATDANTTSCCSTPLPELTDALSSTGCSSLGTETLPDESEPEGAGVDKVEMTRHLLLRAKAALMRLRASSTVDGAAAAADKFLGETIASLDDCLTTDRENASSEGVLLSSSSGDAGTETRSASNNYEDEDEEQLSRLKSWSPNNNSNKDFTNLSCTDQSSLNSVSNLFPSELLRRLENCGAGGKQNQLQQQRIWQPVPPAALKASTNNNTGRPTVPFFKQPVTTKQRRHLTTRPVASMSGHLLRGRRFFDREVAPASRHQPATVQQRTLLSTSTACTTSAAVANGTTVTHQRQLQRKQRPKPTSVRVMAKVTHSAGNS